MRALLLLLFSLIVSLPAVHAQVRTRNRSAAPRQQQEVQQARQAREAQRRYLDSLRRQQAAQPAPILPRLAPQPAPAPLEVPVAPSSSTPLPASMAVQDTQPKPKARPASTGIDSTAPLWIQRRQARRLGLPEPTSQSQAVRRAEVQARVAPARRDVRAAGNRARTVASRKVAGPQAWIGAVLQSWLYQGDLDGTAGFYPGGGLRLLSSGSGRLQGMFQASYGQFAADNWDLDPDDIGRPNRYVHTSIWAFEGQVRGFLLRHAKVRPFVGVGLSYLLFRPEDSRGTALRAQASTRTLGETYAGGALAIPLSAGANWHISPRLALSLDYSYILPTTDYLDNIGELGNASGNDRLHRISVGLHVGIR